MAIIETCCFWKSLRKASYACGIYTLIYFIITCITMSMYLNDEKQYLIGEVEAPQGESILEKEKISSTTVIFYILLLICESIGILSSIVLFIGLHLDKRELLLPWILNILVDILLECSHCVYLFILETTKFEPLTAIIFTTDFFVLCLNIYCLVCVISQYQEYKAGRGSANDFSPFNGGVHYIPPPQSTYLNKMNKNTKAVISPSGGPHTNFSSIPEEPTVNGNSNITILHKSPFHRRGSNSLRKHVQFPDENMALNHSTIMDEIKLQVNGIEPLPEYSEDILSWHELNNKSSLYYPNK